VDVQVNTNYSFTLITAHLKSKRAVAQATKPSCAWKSEGAARED